MNGTAVRNNFTSTEIYADQVVKNAMKKQPKKRIWVGGVTTIIWAVSTFLWATAWVRYHPFSRKRANARRISS